MARAAAAPRPRHLAGAGGVGGAWLGASVALGLYAELLQKLFAAFLLFTGAQMLWSTRAPHSTPAPVDVA